MPNRLRVSFLATLSMCMAVAFVVAAVSLPPNVMRDALPRSSNKYVVPFMPQGWAYFTRDARSATYQAWTLDPKSRSIVQRPLAAFDRSRRINGAQLLNVGEVAKDKKWRDCRTINQCHKAVVGSPTYFANFKVVSGNPALCKPFMLVRYQPIPWQYRNVTDRMKMSAIKVRMSC